MTKMKRCMYLTVTGFLPVHFCLLSLFPCKIRNGWNGKLFAFWHNVINAILAPAFRNPLSVSISYLFPRKPNNIFAGHVRFWPSKNFMKTLLLLIEKNFLYLKVPLHFRFKKILLAMYNIPCQYVIKDSCALANLFFHNFFSLWQHNGDRREKSFYHGRKL